MFRLGLAYSDSANYNGAARLLDSGNGKSYESGNLDNAHASAFGFLAFEQRASSSKAR
jgi:hypothetical protein